MGLVIDTPPTRNQILGLVTLEEMKKNLRIAHTQEDDLIEQKIVAAYDWLAGENGWLNRAVLEEIVTIDLPGFKNQQYYTDSEGKNRYRWMASSWIELPRPKLITVSSVKYWKDGVDTTLSAADYEVQKTGLMGRISLGHQKSWPSSIDTRHDSVRITYVAGYGEAADVKTRAPGIVQAIMLLAADAYRNREDTYAEPRLVAVNRKIINGVTRFAGRYRIVNRYA